MGGRARSTVGILVGVSLLALSLLVGVPALTGHPLVSYASSGSMEPTIGVFDAFFVDPYPRDIRVDDIIVYDSVTRGGPAVHRVVGGDESGWYTKGDANPSADQDGAGEPTVTAERILGKVVTRADGTPILLDDVGITVVESRIQIAKLENKVGGSRQLAALGFLLLAAASAIPAVLGSSRRRPSRPLSMRTSRFLRRAFPRGILGKHMATALVLVLLASTAWAAAHARTSVPVSLVVVADPSAADDTRAVAPGGELARDIRVGSLGLLPTVIIVEPNARIRVENGSATLGSASVTEVRVYERGGSTSGLQRDDVQIWRYPAFLPERAIVAMHERAPGLPYAALALASLLVGGLWFASLGIANVRIGGLFRFREEWL